MQIMLLLTAEQAARVRGPSDIDPDAVLDPIALPDGSFALPASVLDDPVHELHHQMLGTLPWASMAPPEVTMAKRRPRTVGIIGAGFSGTMLAVHLIEMSSTPRRSSCRQKLVVAKGRLRDAKRKASSERSCREHQCLQLGSGALGRACR